jgi:hypothetical protein
MPLESRGAFDLVNFCVWSGIGRSQAYEEAKKGRLRLTKCGRKTLVTLDDARRGWRRCQKSVARLPNDASPPPSTDSTEAVCASC